MTNTTEMELRRELEQLRAENLMWKERWSSLSTSSANEWLRMNTIIERVIEAVKSEI